MPRNALITDTKNVQWPTGLPGPDDKVRITRAEAEVLDETRPAFLGKGDQMRLGAIKVALIADIIDGRWVDVYTRLGKLSGLGIPNGFCLRCGGPAVVDGIPAGKPMPSREERTIGQDRRRA